MTESGSKSLYAALRRMVDFPASKLRTLLNNAQITNLDRVQELLGHAAQFGRSVEVFRAANLLGDRAGEALCIPIPIGPPEDRNLVQLFWQEMEKENENNGKDKTFTIYLRMKFSKLGQVRALMQKDKGPVRIRFFVDKQSKSPIADRLPELKQQLEAVGCPCSIAVSPLESQENPDLSIPNHLMRLAGKTEGVSVRA